MALAGRSAPRLPVEAPVPEGVRLTKLPCDELTQVVPQRVDRPKSPAVGVDGEPAPIGRPRQANRGGPAGGSAQALRAEVEDEDGPVAGESDLRAVRRPRGCEAATA